MSLIRILQAEIKDLKTTIKEQQKELNMLYDDREKEDDRLVDYDCLCALYYDLKKTHAEFKEEYRELSYRFKKLTVAPPPPPQPPIGELPKAPAVEPGKEWFGTAIFEQRCPSFVELPKVINPNPHWPGFCRTE